MNFDLRAVLTLLLACLSVGASASNHNVTPAARQAGFISTLVREVDGRGLSTQWKSIAWKGERITQQIHIPSATADRDITFAVSDLKSGISVIPATRIRLFNQQWAIADRDAFDCDTARDWSRSVRLRDPLVEIGTIKLLADQAAFILVSVDIPASTPAGIYRSILKMRSGPDALGDLDIELRVQDYILPPPAQWEFALNIWQFPVSGLAGSHASGATGLRVWSNEHLAQLATRYALLADLGQKSVTTYLVEGALGAPSMVRWLRDPQTGEFDYDFSDFDRYVESAKQWGIGAGIDAFSVIGWTGGRIGYIETTTGASQVLDLEIGSVLWGQVWDRFLTAFAHHLRKRGWFEQTTLYLDEVKAPELQAAIDLIKANRPDWKIGLAYGHEVSETVSNRLHSASAILGLSLPDERVAVRTFYTSCTQRRPNLSLTGENAPGEPTWMPLHAYANGLDGYLRWAFDAWGAQDPRDARDSAYVSGDSALVYRGTGAGDEVVPSVRYALLRRGIQNVEKIRVLRKAHACASHERRRKRLGVVETALAAFRAFDDALERDINALESAIAEASKTRPCPLIDRSRTL